MTNTNTNGDESHLFSLLEDVIDFAIYRIAYEPQHPYGGRVIMVSPSIKEIVGIEEPYRFETWFENIHPEDRQRITEANQQSWEKHTRYDQDARFFNEVKQEWVWIRTISTPVFDAQGKLTYFNGLVLDITEQKKNEEDLKYRVNFENLILSLANNFINLTPKEINPAIDAALRSIGEFTNVDRCYLFSFSEDKKSMSCTHEWCAPGISVQIDQLQNLGIEALNWSNQKLIRGEVLHIPSVKDLPLEANNEKEEFTRQGILSLLAVPMVYQGNVIGLLGFDAVRSYKTWSEQSVNLLKVAGSIFTNALENKRSQEKLIQAHEELEQRVTERTFELKQINQTLRIEIEQRKRAQESLKISQALYTEVFDNSPLQMFVIDVLPDQNFRVVRTNPAHQRESGMPPENIWGKTIDELVIPEVAEAIKQHYRDCVETGHPIEYEESAPSPYWNLERIRTFNTTIAPVFDESGKIVRLVGSSQDITEQKQAQEIILDRSREEAVVSERSRLARELHDAVTQTLFSTTLTAEILPKIMEKNPEEGWRKLNEMRELTRGALAEMRTLLLELRPEALADAELKDLLHHLTNAFIAQARIPTDLKINGQCELPVDVKITFYRITQEALNNIIKHSQAEHVSIQMVCEPNQIQLTVIDDGVGFNMEQQLSSDHFGLNIILERAEQINATVKIESQPGKGTQIRLLWTKGSTKNVQKQ